MKVNDNDLKKYYQEYIEGKSPSSSRGCPSRVDLVKAFNPKTSEKQKTKIVDHIAKCHNCAEEFEIIRQIFKASQKMATEIEELLSLEEKKEEIKKRARFFPRYLSWAAVLIVFAIALTLILNYSGLLEKERERGTGEVKIQLIVPGEGAKVVKQLKDQPLLFKWRSMPDTKFYIFKLFNEALIPIYESDKIFDNHFAIPADLYKGLLVEKNYFWMVIGYTEKDKKVESDLQEFNLVNE
jgi:hypothetical protein